MQITYTNIIIGAGPAGIQCGYFFKKYNIPYIILEKELYAGSFFNKYPHSGKLISINKKNIISNNNDFRLRHDWNSLLNDEKYLFEKYSDEFYPDREALFEYLQGFVIKNDLNVSYNIKVSKILKKQNDYLLLIDNSNDIYICNKLIIATGITTPHIPAFVYNVISMPKHYCEFEKDYFKQKQNLLKYEKKNIVIIGDGNSAYELANILLSYTNKTCIIGKKYKNNWSISSHYAGGLRSNYFSFLDSFYLKSLNAIDEFDIEHEAEISIEEISEGKYNILRNNRFIHTLKNIDEIILCTGWIFDQTIFDFTINMNNKKYPEIKKNFESTSHQNLFFIGALMHSFDNKESSGGFIHGFRYLIHIFIKMNYNIPFTCYTYNTNDDIYTISNKIVYRINNSSDIYQMFGYICDIIVLYPEKKEFIYYENMIDGIIDIDNNYIFYIYLKYGKSSDSILELPFKQSDIGNESRATFLHPVIIIKQNNNIIEIVHFDEDLFAEFTEPTIWYDRIVRLLKSYT